jgi:hypothetical protein
MTDGIGTRRSNRQAGIGGQFAPRPNKRRGRVFSLALRRLRDIENIIRFRHGHCLPELMTWTFFCFKRHIAIFTSCGGRPAKSRRARRYASD